MARLISAYVPPRDRAVRCVAGCLGFLVMSCGGTHDGPAADASSQTTPEVGTGLTVDGGSSQGEGGPFVDSAAGDVDAAAVEGGAAPDTVPWLTEPATHVNTLVGTTNGGNMFPGADYPFGMVQWSPDTTPHRDSGGGYDYNDAKIVGFSLTHISGPGCSGALGDVPILPLTGGLPSGNLNAVTQPFGHTGEVGTAGYYSVHIGTPSVVTELTATLHGAMARFTYPATNNANLLFKLQDSEAGNFGNASATIVNNQEVTGSTSSGNFCGTGHPYTLHFDVVFDQPFTASQIIPVQGQTSPGFIFLTFDTSKNAVVQAKVGISFVSAANAHTNGTAENPSSQWNFDATKGDAVSAWNTLLGKIRVTGGTPSDQELLYTSLYHSLLHPNVGSDANGQYMGFDDKVHSVSGTQKDHYVNYSGWDIYRSQAQLSALVAPEAMSDSAQSMLDDAAQNGGTLPKWSLENGENGIMVGDPSDGIIAAYYAFGARQFDTATALKVMLKEATVPNAIRPGLSDYESLGYLPDESYDQSVGVALEYCQADFALSQFAAALGDAASASSMLKRSQNWKNLFDPSVGMFIPKRKNGAFVGGIGLTNSHGYTEGDASQYRWIIAFDRQAQLSAMGGPSVVNPALDAFFSKLDDYQGPSALMSNEFELGVPYWNNDTGEPWKTQEIVNRIRTQLFHDAPAFLDNNDDLGAESSSLVWWMLGMYPDYPGSAILTLNGPEFTNERIDLPGGASLTIRAPGASRTTPYIQSLQVNGQPSSKTWLDASVVKTGATLDFTMGAAANQSWGSSPGNAPPL